MKVFCLIVNVSSAYSFIYLRFFPNFINKLQKHVSKENNKSTVIWKESSGQVFEWLPV